MQLYIEKKYMTNPNERTELVNSIKNLFALNPVLARGVVVCIILYLIYRWYRYYNDKKRPDLPYEHTQQIYFRLDNIEKSIKTLTNNLWKKWKRH